MLVGKVTRIADTGSLGILRHCLGVVHIADIGTLITTGSKVHTGRKGRIRTRFRVLPVRPHHLEVFGNRVVGQAFVTGLGHLIACLQQTGIFVTLHIVRLHIQRPRTFREDIRPQLQVHLVTDGEVISTVRQTEATIGVIHIGRHQKTGLVTARKREKEKWNGKRKRHILYYQIGRSRHHVLFRTYLGISHLHIKMGVVMMVTSRVTTAPHIEFIIIPFLGIITGHVSLALLADNIADKTSFTLEVITDSIGFVGGVPVFEDRSSLGCSYRIDHATGKNRTVVHIHRDDISLQVSTRITHLSLAVKMGKATLRKYNGVIGFVGYGSIQCILLGRRSRYRILLQRIGRKPLSPLQGVSHLQTIPYLQRVCPLNIRRRNLRSTALRSSPTGEKKQDE